MCVLTTPDLRMSELIAWAWLLSGVELHAAPEGSVLVLKGKLSLHEFCCAFLDARQMAVLQMGSALVCLGLSYSVTPVYHCSKHVAVSALICTVLSLSMKHHQLLQSQAQGWPKADIRVDKVLSLLSRDEETASGKSGLLSRGFFLFSVHLPLYVSLLGTS